MSEEKKSSISPNAERIIKGLFLVLFSLVLAINVGKVGRTLAFPFIYLFGASYYFLLAVIFAIGLYKVFSKKPLKFKTVFIPIGITALFIGVSFIIGYSLMKQSGFSYADGVVNNINSLHDDIKNGFYQSGYLNLFAKGSHWNIGILGILFSSLVGSDAVILTLGIIFAIFGVLFILVKPVLFLIKRNEGIREDDSSTIEEPEQEEIAPIYTPEKEETPEVPYGYENEDDIAPSDFDFNDNASLDDSFASRNSENINLSEFSRLDFRRKDVEPVSFSYDEDYNDNAAEARPTPVMSEANKSYDESLVSQKPEFEELVSHNDAFDKPVTPIVEPKKKKVRRKWTPPSSDLLETYEVSEAIEANSKAAEARVQAINTVFQDIGVGARCTGYTIGSSVTRFNIEYAATVSSKSVEKIVTDIAIRLGGLNVRFSPIVEGETYSGLEIPNVKITTVGFKDVFELLPDVKKHPLAVGFGKNISGKVVSADFDEFPHLLVAGTTGSGKSIYTHSIIATLIMRVSPDDLRIVLVDPKRVEMTKYRDMPHLLCPIITEADKAKVMLTKLVDEMNARYQRFADADECSNIKQYNEWAKEHDEELMPYILVVIDEYADLVDNCKEISQPVVSIAQKARAAGIHMLISTQRPSTNIITGVIKGNLPTHVALMTSSAIDSVTIIGEGGAEKLLGKGDMLVQSPLVSRVGVTRLQGCFIQNKEIARVVGYLKEHYETEYDENYLDLVDHSKEVASGKIASGEVEKEADAAEEAKYQSIKEWVMTQPFTSMSRIQRECGVGFNRAGRFFKRLQNEGIVSFEVDGASKGCKVLVHDADPSGYDDVVTSDELTRY